MPLFDFFSNKNFEKTRIFLMNLLNVFFLKQANLKIQKRLGEVWIMDSLKHFFFK